MKQRVDTGLTLVEIAVALAIGLSVLVAAASAMRVSMQTITKANRLSLENALMRTAVTSALNEADFWQAYDPMYDAPARTLRDDNEPFNFAVDYDSTSGLDPDMNLLHLPKTWWRGFGYYDTFSDTRSLDSTRRWGDYSLTAKLDHPDPEHAALPEHQEALLANLGFFAALDMGSAGVIWKHRAENGNIRHWYRTYKRNGTDSVCLYNDHAESTTIAADRYEATWRGVHGLTTQNIRTNQTRHTWFLPRFLDGEEWGNSLTDSGVKDYFTDKWRTTKYLARSADTLELVSRGDVPEDWPTVKLTRVSWFFRGTPTYWIRATVTDPLTGRQMAMSVTGGGTSLRGARMQRQVIENGGDL